MEYLTRKKLEHRFGLSWMDAERILQEQTGRAIHRRLLPIACWFAAFGTPAVLSVLLPDGRNWDIAAKATAIPLLLASYIAARLVSRDAILEAAQSRARGNAKTLDSGFRRNDAS